MKHHRLHHHHNYQHNHNFITTASIILIISIVLIITVATGTLLFLVPILSQTPLIISISIGDFHYRHGDDDIINLHYLEQNKKSSFISAIQRRNHQHLHHRLNVNTLRRSIRLAPFTPRNRPAALSFC